MDPLQADGGHLNPGAEAIAASATSGGGSSLPMLGQIQSAFGKHDLSGVRAHQGAGADRANQEMGSRAFATGNDVVLGSSGSDLHTVAHEAAHVVQQRGGVQLAGGVGQAGDAYEVHADQVADAVVAGESAEALLDAAPGGGGSGGIQLASDYSGLLPDHDALGGAYDYEGSKKKEFTYHHIVPENRLKAAAKRIQEVQGRANDAELDTAAAGLEIRAQALREETRAVNLAHAIASDVLDVYAPLADAVPSSAELLPLIRGNADLRGLYDAVRRLLQPKLAAVFRNRKRAAKRAIKGMPKLEGLQVTDPAVVAAVNKSKLDAYGVVMITAADVVTASEDAMKRKGFSKGSFNNRIDAIIDGRDLNWFLTQNASRITEGNAGTANSLINAVRDKGLASDDHGFKHALQWNPGNIHRGPKGDTRIQGEGQANFDALLDDGGAGFERAAVNLVASEHFGELTALNKAVEDLLALAPNDDGEVDASKEVLRCSRLVQDRGATSFDASQWEEKTVGDRQAMRIKRDEDKIAAARLG